MIFKDLPYRAFQDLNTSTYLLKINDIESVNLKTGQILQLSPHAEIEPMPGYYFLLFHARQISNLSRILFEE